jgi:hypothetical protein
VTSLELDQHIDITLWPKIIAQYRAKEGQLADVVPAAEVFQFLSWDADFDFIIHKNNYSKTYTQDYLYG